MPRTAAALLGILATLALLGPGTARPDPEPAAATPSPTPAPPESAEPPPAFRSPAARRYLVERIVILGLAHTREAAVRQHLLVAEGDVLDPDRVLLTRLRLLQLGWFSRVETRVERGTERGRVALVFEVVERNTIVVTDLVFGSTGPQPFYGGLGLSQQNFLGRGYALGGAFVYGGSPIGRAGDPDRFAARAGFFAPDVVLPGGPRLVLGASALFLRGEEFACGDAECKPFRSDYGDAPRVRYQRAGGELSFGLRAGPFERVLASYRYERVHALALDPLVHALVIGVPGSPPAPPILPGDSNLSALTLSWELDTRDDFFLPTEGLRAHAQVTLGSAALGGDYEYSRYLLQLETAYSLLGRRLRFQGALGATQGNAPFFERFYPADWSYFAVGPAQGRALELNFTTDSRYDAILAMGGLEYALPLWSGGGFFHRGYVALGARGVFSSARPGGGRTAFSKIPLSADVALRLDTPVGTFNASLGYAADNAL